MKRLLSLALTLAVFCISTSDASAGGLFRRHHSQPCTTCNVAPPSNGTPGSPGQRGPAGPRGPAGRDGSVVIIPVCDIGTMEIIPIVDFDLTAGTAGVKQIPCDRFAIRIPGDSPCIATLSGEPVTFAAKCTVVVPQKYLNCMIKTGCPFIMLEPFTVVLKGTFDQEGVARFNRSDVYTAMGAQLRRLRFFDHPSLFGLERIGIKIEGCARTGSFLFEHTNSLTLLGTVDEALRSTSEAASNGLAVAVPVAQ